MPTTQTTKPQTPKASSDQPIGSVDPFVSRHLGLSDSDQAEMLSELGLTSLEALIDEAVPAKIRLDRAMSLSGADAQDERTALSRLQAISQENQPMTSMIGMGYHATHTPSVIRRCVLENPLWYTPYTPYQAEIAQGRLEALLNFQTMVSDLTGMEIANASLLDEATAAAEAMSMCFAVSRQKRNTFVVDRACHPQTLAVVRTRADSLGIRIVEADLGADDGNKVVDHQVCGVLVQRPDTLGVVRDFDALVQYAHEQGALVVAACDLLSLVLLQPPGQWAGEGGQDSDQGADIAVGSTQRFGVPMGYGGPHAAYFATRQSLARKMPGRLVGVSKDAHGNKALRLAIQTREQHIKRDRATSNICTAQVLLANIAGFYALYHGPDGLKRIAQQVHQYAVSLRHQLDALGLDTGTHAIFDTVQVQGIDAEKAKNETAKRGINLRVVDAQTLTLACDELTDDAIVREVVDALATASGNTSFDSESRSDYHDEPTWRSDDILTHPIFHTHRSEHDLLRYITSLQEKDISLANSMIPLGSCTMKLNAAAEMLPVTWDAFANMHPFCPADQARGYHEMISQLSKWLAKITGFSAVSMQPNAGSQGEYAGLLAIRSYHHAKGDTQRDVCLIPTSAHGTNPASAVIAGMKVVPIQCDDQGDIDLADLEDKVRTHVDRLAALMVTYPSTHGVFEQGVTQACQLVHDHGGLVYMDGANLNAQVGLTSRGYIGADVCHLNLHKTFCIPHGGGGPGMGPIAVNDKLAPFLPSTELDKATGNANDDSRVSAAPFGSPMILPISWMYIAMMGSEGLTQATQCAILSANYMAHRLKGHYDILFTGSNGRVAHEFVVDCRAFEKSVHVTVEDIAKRLIDFGFHAPTMSWPVPGTLMIEPTESEPLAELDRFCQAMIVIRQEIANIEQGKIALEDSPLRHAPHSQAVLTSDDWPHIYSRQQAAYPAAWLRERKFFPPVSRVDNAHGDRNLVCSCPPMEQYGDACEA